MFDRSFQDFGLVEKPKGRPIALHFFSGKTLDAWLDGRDTREARDVRANLERDPGSQFIRYGSTGNPIAAYVFVSADYVDGTFARTLADDRFIISPWARDLSAGTYTLSKSLGLTTAQQEGLVFGWGAGAYAFTKYKSTPKPNNVFLTLPKGIDSERVRRELTATYWIQDLINEPSNVLTCDALTQVAEQLANRFGASFDVIKGNALLEQNFPLIHAVGKGSAEEPRLVDMRWGDPTKPTVTLVGKGVIFDTGGTNLKDEHGMRDMKYDMAGAAHALGTAYMVMDANLPVSLRVLLPIVENMNGPHAYKPGDVLQSRSGKSLEVYNTDAEGRLILSDALHEANNPTYTKAKKPSLIMGFGTTGWHGFSEYPGWGIIHSTNANLKTDFVRCAEACQEYIDRRVYLKPLQRELEASQIADVGHAAQHHRYDDLMVFGLLDTLMKGEKPKGGETPFGYIDLAPWREPNTTATQYPKGLPDGGFASGARTTFHFIEKRFG